MTLWFVMAVTVGAAGCTKSNAEAGDPFCDEGGCYVCEPGASACWPLDNADCVRDSDCGPGQSCTSIGCVDGCTVALDCDRGLVCNGGLCVPPGFDCDKAQQPDTQQPDGSEVSPDSGNGPCETDEQCGDGLVCRAESGQCIPRCETDDQCATGEVCLPCGKCQREEIPATCGAAPDYCDEGDALSCGAGKSCIAGRCHFRCDAGFSCPVGQACSADGLCKADLDPTSVECQFDFQCDGGACINGFCHAGCLLSEQCGDTMVCQMGVCQPDFRPAPQD